MLRDAALTSGVETFEIETVDVPETVALKLY